ncbi:hypothetical protein BH09PLA1_BH09PLA1_21980 [soil metagenome]
MTFRCTSELRRSRNRLSGKRVALASALAAACVCGSARADFTRWVGGDGLWGVDANWNPVGQPGPMNPVLIDQGIFTATHDDPLSNSVVAQILIENRMTLALSGGTLSATGGDTPEAYFTSVGVFGRSHYFQTGGVMEAPLGIDVSGQSLFEVAGGEVNGTGETAGMNVATQSAYLQSGGSNHLSLSIGGGTASITNGTLGDTFSSSVKVLFGGTLTQQGGQVLCHSIILDTAGHYEMNGGMIDASTITLGKLDAQGASVSNGTFAQSGGSVWIEESLSVLSGKYSVTGGTLNASCAVQIGTELVGVPSNAVLDNRGTVVLNDFSPGIAGNGTFDHHGMLEKTGVGSVNTQIGTSFVANGGTINVLNGAVTINANLYAPTPLAGDALIKQGLGVLVLNGAQDWHAGAKLRLLGGETIVSTDLGTGTARPDVHLSDATLTVSTSQSISTLTADQNALVRIAPGTSSTVMVGTLQLDALTGAKLDVADNSLMLFNASRPQVESLIRQARNGGAWDGPGITSSTAASEVDPRISMLAVISGGEFLSLNGENATFNLFTVTATDVLVKLTYYGDTDLNNVVNFDDYARTDAGFNNTLTGWLNGDFDYNGVVNFDDYALIDLAFNSQMQTLARAVSFLNGDDRSERGMNDPALRIVQEHFAQFGEGYAQQFLNSVPEPASAIAAAMLTAPLLVRRRKAT